VEVRAGIVTPVMFPMELRLGIAGRVRGTDGAPAADRDLAVEDAAGRVVAQGRTDVWGYYRIDGLSPGRYRLRLVGDATSPATWIELERDFLFGIDLRVDAAVR
jgi:hypothetical protein